jgi:hypothetical protein
MRLLACLLLALLLSGCKSPTQDDIHYSLTRYEPDQVYEWRGNNYTVVRCEDMGSWMHGRLWKVTVRKEGE